MGRGSLRSLAALALALILASCGKVAPPVTGPVGPPATALAAGVFLGPPISQLQIASDDAAAALVSFRESCPRLLARIDASRLTSPGDWKFPCEAARTWPAAQAQEYFARMFELVRVGDGNAALLPALKLRAFNFTSASDAV